MLRFERLLLADEQSFVPTLTTWADAYRHGRILRHPAHRVVVSGSSMTSNHFCAVMNVRPAASGAKPTFGRICTSLKANNRYPSEHNNVVTQKRQIALLLNSDLAEPAPDGMFPTALMRGHDG